MTSSAWQRQRRDIYAQRIRSADRGLVVEIRRRIVIGARAVSSSSYWGRRLQLDRRLARFVRIAISRPLKRSARQAQPELALVAG